MLRKKEYLGVLKKGLSKIQVVQLFNEKYHPRPAIRILERNYHAGRYKAEMFCDNCGYRFEREYLTGDKPSKEDCCCPECGFGIAYQEQYYRENDCYCLSDTNKAYSLVFDGEKVIQPTLVLFEKVCYVGKEFHLIRRFHFDLERGQISSVYMYRGMIIPEEAENNFALLYEKDNGGIAVSRAESPYNWFSKYILQVDGTCKGRAQAERQQVYQNVEAWMGGKEKVDLRERYSEIFDQLIFNIRSWINLDKLANYQDGNSAEYASWFALVSFFLYGNYEFEKSDEEFLEMLQGNVRNIQRVCEETVEMCNGRIDLRPRK